MNINFNKVDFISASVGSARRVTKVAYNIATPLITEIIKQLGM